MDNKTLQRNNKAYEILAVLLSNAEKEILFNKPFDKAEVEILFKTAIWGHREVVLTIVIARLLDPAFKATEDFYKCHPRTLFEKPIRKALREYGIPHRKSGPLNVAKNIKKINVDWATDKNEEDVAMSVVKIVEKLESVSDAELNLFAAAFVARYKLEATRVKEMEVVLPPRQNPLFIASLCADLINNVPDGGATAQFIVGLLMEAQKNDRGSDLSVTGYTDSVSTTNTTSKKPGDIIEFMHRSGSELVYEVTTKEFSDDRLIESHESVIAYGHEIADVFVLCRPADIPASLETSPTSYLMASTQYKELSYYFINIYNYIQSAILFIAPSAREDFYKNLIAYVNDIDRSEKVKIFFKDWHSKRG